MSFGVPTSICYRVSSCQRLPQSRSMFLSAAAAAEAATGRDPAPSPSAIPTTLKVLDSSDAADALSRLRLCLQWAPCGHTAVGLDCEWGRVGKGQKYTGVELLQIAPILQLGVSIYLYYLLISYLYSQIS